MEEIYLRLSLTPECNLRCRYCRPSPAGSERKPARALTDRELRDIVAAIHEVRPIHKLRFTGGEPLLRPNHEKLIASFRRLLPGVRLCLTTNGTLLKDRAASLRKAGLHSLNISLDTLDEGGFLKLTGRRGLGDVLQGIADAKRAAFDTLKLNTVLLRNFNLAQLPALIRLAGLHGAEIRFVELMPFGVGAELFSREYVSSDEALQRIKESFPYLRSEEPTPTAKRHVLDVDGSEVTIGFITSVSSPFCERCDRIRLDSRGRLYPCLRSESGVDISGRDRGESIDKIRSLLLRKHKPELSWPRRSMVQMGG